VLVENHRTHECCETSTKRRNSDPPATTRETCIRGLLSRAASFTEPAQPTFRHRIAPGTLGTIVAALDAAGVDGIEVSHGDGLAGSSMNYGPGSNTDWEWIETAAANISNARLTTLLLPGIGTIDDLKHAASLGVRSVRVATHCTEADVSAQHITTARELGMDVSGSS